MKPEYMTFFLRGMLFTIGTCLTCSAENMTLANLWGSMVEPDGWFCWGCAQARHDYKSMPVEHQVKAAQAFGDAMLVSRDMLREADRVNDALNRSLDRAAKNLGIGFVQPPSITVQSPSMEDIEAYVLDDLDLSDEEAAALADEMTKPFDWGEFADRPGDEKIVVRPVDDTALRHLLGELDTLEF